MVGAIGFEPTTPGPPDQCANRAAPRSDMFSIAQFRGLVNVSLAGYSIAGGNGPSEGAGRHVRSLRLTPFIRQWSFLSYLEYWILFYSLGRPAAIKILWWRFWLPTSNRAFFFAL